MATFTAGSTTTITLDYNDSLTVVGKADALVTPSVGSAFRTSLTGTQVLGPFKVTSTTVALTALSDGSYTSSSDPRGDVPLTTDELIATKALVSGARKKLAAIGDSLTGMAHQLLTVTAAARSANVMTITTSAAHGMYAGARGRLDGIDTFDANIRGTYTVLSVPTTTTATVANSGADNAALTIGSTPRFANLQRRANDGFLNWMMILGNQSFDLATIYASPGRRVADMLQFVPDVIASGASYCVVLGGTNDIYLDAASSASIIAGLRAVHEALIAGGVQPIICTIPPSAGTAYTAARLKTTAQVNDALRADCRLNSRKILADLYAATVDSVNAAPGTAKTGYFVTNDVHWTQKGAYYAGKRAAADVAAAVFRVDDRVTSSADTVGFDASSRNILDAGPWLATGGTISAPVAGIASWVASTTVATVNSPIINSGKLYTAVNAGTAGTVAPTHTSGDVSDGVVTWRYVGSSAVATLGSGLVAERGGTCAALAGSVLRADGIGYDVCVYATPAAANDLVNIRTAGSTWQTRVVAGTTYTPSSSVSVTGVSGSTLTFAYPYISATVDGASITYVSTPLYPSEATPIDEDWSGVLGWPSFCTTGTSSSHQLYNSMVFSASGATAGYRIGRMSIRSPSVA